MSFDPSSQQNNQESGLPVGQRQLFGNIGLGTGGFLDPIYRNLLTRTGDPLGFSVDTRPQMQGGTGGWLNLGQNVSGQGIDTLRLPQLSASGLYPQQQNLYDTAFQQAVKQSFGQQSGQFAQAGFNNPEAIGAIAGSAAQNVAPQLLASMLPIAGTNVMNQLVTPEALANQRYASAIDYLRTILSGGSTGSTGIGAAQGPGLGYAVTGDLASGFGQGLGAGAGAAIAKCWIAQALYGRTSWKVAVIRDWLNSVVSRTWWGGWWVRWYIRHGETEAARIWRHPWRAMFWRPLFDGLLAAATRDAQACPREDR